MTIPFTKAHGAKNDFLLTWKRDAPEVSLPEFAQAICDRNTGVGADGWMIVDERPGIRLFNSDGSEPELSGNGTRCAAAFLLKNAPADREFANPIEIATGAGLKTLRLISRDENRFAFEMNMGRPTVIAARFALPLSGGVRDVTLVDCGNPQCVVPVTGFDFDWAAMGAEIERYPHFPNRTNVSFIRAAGGHTIEARFFERGAGVTMSSGTGSTGAAVGAIVRAMAASPVRVQTPAGPLDLVERAGEFLLTGPAVIVAEGVFLFQREDT
jgi:diaminopimelate epimerase